MVRGVELLYSRCLTIASTDTFAKVAVFPAVNPTMTYGLFFSRDSQAYYHFLYFVMVVSPTKTDRRDLNPHALTGDHRIAAHLTIQSLSMLFAMSIEDSALCFLILYYATTNSAMPENKIAIHA